MLPRRVLSVEIQLVCVKDSCFLDNLLQCVPLGLLSQSCAWHSRGLATQWGHPQVSVLFGRKECVSKFCHELQQDGKFSEWNKLFLIEKARVVLSALNLVIAVPVNKLRLGKTYNIFS